MNLLTFSTRLFIQRNIKQQVPTQSDVPRCVNFFLFIQNIFAVQVKERLAKFLAVFNKQLWCIVISYFAQCYLCAVDFLRFCEVFWTFVNLLIE